MRGGSDSPGFLSSSSSRSGTITGLSAMGIMLALTELRSQQKFLSQAPRSGLLIVDCERPM
jgi:hypothetical protein